MKTRSAPLETRVRGLNATAEIFRSSYAKVDLDKILGIGAFDLSRTMAVDEHFLDDHHHQHDPSLDSISFVFDASFDKERLNAYLAELLQARGDDIFRLKGIIAVSGDNRRGVLQGVHRIFEIRPADPWGPKKRDSKIVFIGRKLDRGELEAGLRNCLARLSRGRGSLRGLAPHNAPFWPRRRGAAASGVT